MRTDPSPRRARPRREPWPWALAGLLAAMGLVLFALLRLGIEHADPLVVDDAFAAGLRLNAEIAERARVEALGWRVDLVATPLPGAVRVRVRLVDAAGRALPAEAVVVRRERPAEGGLDTEVSLQPAGDAFEGVVALPRPGAWRLDVRAARGGETVQAAYALQAPS